MKQLIIDKARELGFDAVGFAPVAVGAREQARLDAFLAAGQHGDMDWMARNAERRRDPRTLWPDARSVIVLAKNYGPERDPLGDLGARDRANISVYARNRDYHDLLKKRLKSLGRWMAEEFGCALKVFVDTAPVLEKPLAAIAFQLGEPRVRLVVVSGRGVYHPGTGAEQAGGRPLWVLPRVPRYLPDGRFSRALYIGCIALHLLPDD
jgi:epoxyqueuosine reductase QueG